VTRSFVCAAPLFLALLGCRSETARGRPTCGAGAVERDGRCVAVPTRKIKDAAPSDSSSGRDSGEDRWAHLEDWPTDATRRGSIAQLCEHADRSRAVAEAGPPSSVDCEIAPTDDPTAEDLAIFVVSSGYLVQAFLARRLGPELEIESEIEYAMSSPEGHVYLDFRVTSFRRTRVGTHDLVLVETQTRTTDYDVGEGWEHDVRRLTVCTPSNSRLECRLRVPLEMMATEFDSEDGIKRGTDRTTTHRATADLLPDGTLHLRLRAGTWRKLFADEETSALGRALDVPARGTRSVVLPFLPSTAHPDPTSDEPPP